MKTIRMIFVLLFLFVLAVSIPNVHAQSKKQSAVDRCLANPTTTIAPEKLTYNQPLFASSVLGRPYDNGISPTRFEVRVRNTIQNPFWPKERLILAEMQKLKDKKLPVV